MFFLVTPFDNLIFNRFFFTLDVSEPNNMVTAPPASLQGTEMTEPVQLSTSAQNEIGAIRTIGRLCFIGIMSYLLSNGYYVVVFSRSGLAYWIIHEMHAESVT